ncbi:MAG: hypothetical protein PHR83_01820 [Paludibacter sp.]|nr:hypothetical protein [Paludibacter sp.]
MRVANNFVETLGWNDLTISARRWLSLGTSYSTALWLVDLFIHPVGFTHGYLHLATSCAITSFYNFRFSF